MCCVRLFRFLERNRLAAFGAPVFAGAEVVSDLEARVSRHLYFPFSGFQPVTAGAGIGNARNKALKLHITAVQSQTGSKTSASANVARANNDGAASVAVHTQEDEET